MKVIAPRRRGRTRLGLGRRGRRGGRSTRRRSRARAVGKVVAEEPADLAPGEYPVVLEPEAVGELLDFLGYLAFNGLVARRGPRRARRAGSGTRVAAPAINLSDSPRFPRTLPRAFDLEGVPKAPLPLIQDGVAHRVVHDTRSAARAGGGARTTGHATAPGGVGLGPHPTNLVLDRRRRGRRGRARGADRARALRDALLVREHRPREADAADRHDPRRDVPHRGRPDRAARCATCASPTRSLRILEATEALTATPRLVAEAEFYGRRFATGVVCPALRAHGFRITGATVAA